MDFIFVVGLIVFLGLILFKPGPEKMNLGDKLVIHKKKCPPHQWFWQEIVDQNGEKQGERMVCKVCGPLSKALSGSQE